MFILGHIVPSSDQRKGNEFL